MTRRATRAWWCFVQTPDEFHNHVHAPLSRALSISIAFFIYSFIAERDLDMINTTDLNI